MSAPTITISKTKVRRGSNSQRKQIVFDQGELAYTIDTKRLFLGTGTTLGGIASGSFNHPPISDYYSLSTIDSEVGDFINVNNVLYQLISPDFTNLNSWKSMGLSIDTSVFSYNANNILGLNIGSLSASYLNSNTVLSGLQVKNGILQLNYNTGYFNISGGSLSIRPNGITEREISGTSIGLGIKGGSGSKIQLDVATSPYLYFGGVSGNTLTFTASGNTPYTLQFTNLSSGWFGPGLNYNLGASYIEVKMDPTCLQVDGTGHLQINPSVTPGTSEWPSITVDKFGRTTARTSAIYDTLTGFSSTSNIGNSLSSIFNGITSGSIPGLQLTYFDVISSNGTSSVSLKLSSAGFITFEGNTTTRTGKPVGRFAIPIFSY